VQLRALSRAGCPAWGLGVPDGPPAARCGAPNVLYVVWDDASIAMWDAFGGLIETPNMRWLAARGLRYSQWHTTALSSPTRSCLLTGRDCDASGMARVGRRGREWRGQSVAIPPQAGTLAEILTANGYRSYCVGKWHLSPSEASAVSGSRRTWPLERGFDRYYGFLGGETCQWYPDLVYDNQHVDPPYSPADGYHLSADLADMAMEFIRDGAEIALGKPWLCYLSFGPNSVPHVAPREWADQYRGRFEMGYDRYREIALANMKRLGVVPENTGLVPAGRRPARDAVAGACVVRPWHALSDDQKQLSSRLAESYAGFCSHTDHQIGRLLDYLEESGQLDDTIVVVCSANATGAACSPDGSSGVSELSASWPGHAGTIPRLSDLAAAASSDRNSAGWAWAFGTPYDMLRQYSLGGSAASPLVISWPREMKDVAGGVRDQYHHAVDIVPTILDCAAVDPPQIIKGHVQAPLQGVSMRYTFTAPDAPSARRTQLYQAPGGRAIYHDGWKAVTVRSISPAGQNDAAGAWELYHVGADRAEIRDLAAWYPRKAAELISLWRAAADDGGSLAPDNQEAAELLANSWPQLPKARASFTRH
jgi:arylsulfatase A-like enzyme